MPALLTRSFSALTGNAYLLLVIAPLMWGGNAVAGRMAADHWQPFTLTCVRWLCAAVILTPFALQSLKKDRVLIRQHAGFLCCLGAFGMAMFNLSLYLALNYTSAVNASIEQAAIPALIMLANFLFLSQRVTWLQIIGLLVTLSGVLITATSGQLFTFLSAGLNRGDVIMMLGCVFYAGYTFGLRWRPEIGWLSFMWVISISASAMSIPFAGWEIATSGYEAPDAKALAILVYVVIFPTIISQLAWARGVELIGSNRAGLFVNLVPIFGSMLAVLLLGESFNWYHFTGLVFVLSGIALAERSVRKV